MELRYFLSGKIGVIEVASELPFGPQYIAFLASDPDIKTEPCDSIEAAIGRFVIDYPETL